MSYRFAGVIDRYLLSSSEFGRRLCAVRPEQWTAATPCTEWEVRHLVNHMTRGNLTSSGSGTRTPWAAIRWARTPARCGDVPRRSEGRAPSNRSWTTPSAR
ncbi:maleylpyruvate isomerase N-terminal domain-containing protein [Streptomyces sp. NPDC058000]|uniref:maleylpyruvate isomerase N-terminal domain-containing protein n=1 Tax=Streptomyces sp. NPDC058000 TaxID=3346299 RepID=UPI0036EE32E4